MSVKSNSALRLSASLKAEAERIAAEDGTTLNQFIDVAVAEKNAAMRTASFFAEWRGRADRSKTLQIIRRAGRELVASAECSSPLSSPTSRYPGIFSAPSR